VFFTGVFANCSLSQFINLPVRFHRRGILPCSFLTLIMEALKTTLDLASAFMLCARVSVDASQLATAWFGGIGKPTKYRLGGIRVAPVAIVDRCLMNVLGSILNMLVASLNLLAFSHAYLCPRRMDFPRMFV